MRARTSKTGRGARAAWAAALGAALLSILVASGTFAARPVFAITVDKSGDPAAVPANGGSVTYSYAVHNVGTGFFSAVNLFDDSCSVNAASYSGDDGNDKLDAGETWTYTCEVTVAPPWTNHVVVDACHDGSVSACNNINHSAHASDSFTVTVAAPTPSPTPVPTAVPTAAPTAVPTAHPAATPARQPPATQKPAATPGETPNATPAVSPGPSPTPTATASAAPTAAPGGTPTPTTTPSTSAGPAGIPSAGGAGSGSTGSPPDGGSGSGAAYGRSAFEERTPGPSESSFDFGVLGTNFFLTLFLLLVFGATSAIFNSTVEANREEIDGWFFRLSKPFRRAGAPLAGTLGWVLRALRRALDGRFVRPAAILALTGLIYGFLSPDFGLNAQSVVLFAALAVGLGAVTYVNEGGAALFASRRLNAPAGVRVHNGALVAAVVCVAGSRLVDFEPGIVFGFVASTAFLAPAALTRREEGKLALYPAILLLTVSLAAWALLGAARALPATNDGVPLSLVEGILAIVFVAGLEGVFYNMLPLTFMDGKALVDWSRRAWVVMFGVATFLFWQLLINPDKGYLDALRQSKVLLVLSLVVVYVVVTLVTWSYFRFRARPVEEPVPAEP